MTLGTGVFFSAVVISVVLLYSATKDRWSWEKGFRPVGFVLLGLIGLFAATYFAWVPLHALIDHPKPFEGMAGVMLGESQADVKFSKGLPEVTCTDSAEKDWSLWAWKISSDTEKTPTYLLVSFQEPYGVWTIHLRADDTMSMDAPTLDHVDKYQTFESIDKRFGPASTITPSEDGLTRTYAYRRYNLRVDFGRGRIRDYGIYHPKHPDNSPWAPGSKRTCIDINGKNVTTAS